jgi:hypothetical protein
MTDLSGWERLCGGPCDGQAVWVEPGCWAVVATRDSDRRNWYHHTIEPGEETPIVAEEAHLYLRGLNGFDHTPNGLVRQHREGNPVWELRAHGPGELS